MKTLNPKWLYAAIVKDENGRRFGTVSKVYGDTLIVSQRGIPHTMSAKELDSKGLISKAAAASPKYVNI